MAKLMIELLNKSPKVLVIGDLIVDQYLWGNSSRISPEAPVQIVNINSQDSLLGGAGNVVNNLKSLGAKVDIISVIGDCDNANELKKLLKDIKVSYKYIFTQKNRITSKKSRIISAHQQVVRFDMENTDPINTHSINLIIKTFKSIVSNYDVILLSDYGKGVLTDSLTESLIDISNNVGKKVIIDPKGSDYRKYKNAYLLTPNSKEASEATNVEINDKSSLSEAIQILKSKYSLNISLITLSEKGIAIFDKDLRVYPTITKDVFDVTGAGDTVIAALGFALACDFEIDKAVQFSNLAAGIVVSKVGNSTTTINEIIEYESIINQSISNENIKTIDQITLISSDLRKIGKKIIFTNGCFDIIHSGHIKYLEEARSMGDVLILGLNSDRSVKTLKGNNRPINSEMDRACVLSALNAVDYVVIFDEDTPYNLIKAIKPNTLVKGGDYSQKKIVGDNLADEIKIAKLIEGKSTSSTIERIKTNYAINN
jgi:D-beta-D-heptose 7-phosphate kinase/D-beta-D-heptose 1-phosphate adenosyltransferase